MHLENNLVEKEILLFGNEKEIRVEPVIEPKIQDRYTVVYRVLNIRSLLVIVGTDSDILRPFVIHMEDHCRSLCGMYQSIVGCHANCQLRSPELLVLNCANSVWHFNPHNGKTWGGDF